MAKAFVVAFIILALFQASQVEAFEENDCFEYYAFSEGLEWVDFLPEKATYVPGDEVYVHYKLESLMESPIVEGRERIQVFYNHPTRGEEMIDEFFVAGELNIMKSDIIDRELTWKIPAGSPSGEYSMKIYFIVGDSYNLAGLSMVPYGPPGVPGDMLKFVVEADGESYMYFGKEDATIDNELYQFSSFAPTVSSGAHKIGVSIASTDPMTAKVTSELYVWDDVSGQPLKSEEKTLSVSSALQVVEFMTPILEPNSYELRITASSGSKKAMIKLRFGVEGPKARLSYSGLTSFPLSAGEPVKAFICMSNSADHETWSSGTGTLRVLDADGETVYTEELGALDIPPTPYGLITGFTPASSIARGSLEVELRDQAGNVVDLQKLDYDYSKFMNIGADLGVDAEMDGDSIGFTVSLQAKGVPIQGDVIVYLLDPNGIVLYAEEVQVDGEYSGSLKAVAGYGTYTLKAKEPMRDLEDQEVILYGIQKNEAEGSSWLLWTVVPVIALVAALAFLFKRKRAPVSVLIIIMLFSFYFMPVVMAGSTHFQPQPEPNQDLNSLGVGSNLKTTKASGVVGVNFYLNEQLTVNNNVLRSSDCCCNNDVLAFGRPNISGEFFAKGGPTDSPPIQFVDDISWVKTEIDSGEYTTETYRFTICSWRIKADDDDGPNRCVIDGAVICESNCGLDTDGLQDLGNGSYKVTADSVDVRADCTPECIIFVDRKEQEYTPRQGAATTTLQKAYGYMEISSDGRQAFSAITNTFSFDVKRVPEKPELQAKLYKPSQLMSGDEFNLRAEVTNTGSQRAYIRGISISGAESRVLYSPKTIAPGETADIIIKASPTSAEGMALDIKYDAENLGCLNSRNNQRSFSLGSSVARGDACTFSSDCPGGSCCGGICRTGVGVCDDIDGDGVLDFWIAG